jgi:hypothetical protein
LQTPYMSRNGMWLSMALGEKLFEESGNVTGLKVTRVHPIEGVTMEVSATIDLKGFGRFPSGKEMGSGIMVQYPHGVVVGNFHGNLVAAEGDQVMWWAHEKGKVVEGGKIRGLATMSAFTNSQKLSWINNLIIALETEFDPESQKFKTTGYEWK